MPIHLPHHTPELLDRRRSYPLFHSSRRKPRRWPLTLRFTSGSIHWAIALPVLTHTLFAALIVYIDLTLDTNLGVPNTITPALSIVVGLLLVFRNSSSYDRFWVGRQDLNKIVCDVRNLSRYFMLSAPNTNDDDRAETEKIVKVLIAMVYAVKNHLRSDWGLAVSREDPEYSALLPPAIHGHEELGCGFPLELAYYVERFIRDGFRRGAYQAPQASMLTTQVNSIIETYGHMETIKLTPIPVCYQIHHKQVLALYCLFLPFAMVDEWYWLSVPTVALVTFTLYGIEGIGQEIENPFGLDRNDIKFEAVCRDTRQEILVLLENWKRGKEEQFI